MPYITMVRRNQLDDHYLLDKPCDCYANNAGELNYVITKLILDYVPNANYTDYNEVIGVLECVKQEFIRRMLVPYEIKKCELNGDVYP